jgi:hypothetical protein
LSDSSPAELSPLVNSEFAQEVAARRDQCFARERGHLADYMY